MNHGFCELDEAEITRGEAGDGVIIEDHFAQIGIPAPVRRVSLTAAKLRIGDLLTSRPRADHRHAADIEERLAVFQRLHATVADGRDKGPGAILELKCEEALEFRMRHE